MRVPPAGHVPGAEHEVCTASRRREPRHVRGIVREVAVHLKDEVGVELERSPEAGEVSGPQPFLLLPMKYVNPGQLACEPIGDLSGPVG